MARKERSTFVQQRLIENASVELKDKERRRELYNYFYRKSSFFKFSMYLRLLTIVFSVYIIYFNKLVITSISPEIVSIYDVEETHFTKRTDSRDHKSIYMTTTLGNKYIIDLLKSKPDRFAIGDTLLIARNIFGKKTYVEKLGGETSNILVGLARCNNYLIFVAGFTILSFMLKDGFDFFSKVIMYSVLFFDLVGILVYFLS
ncbi:MAG: hypothetical protein H0U95_17600 [Bacteroidetes bacterium]|nr:hypothetical protein [Bacteroidota bacterium]